MVGQGVDQGVDQFTLERATFAGFAEGVEGPPGQGVGSRRGPRPAKQGSQLARPPTPRMLALPTRLSLNLML